MLIFGGVFLIPCPIPPHQTCFFSEHGSLILQGQRLSRIEFRGGSTIFTDDDATRQRPRRWNGHIIGFFGASLGVSEKTNGRSQVSDLFGGKE